MLGLVLTALLAMSVTATTAPQRSRREASSGADQAHAFDFWIGEWNIRQRVLTADGSWLELPAQTRVAPALDGRALVEHWRGEVQFFWEGMTAAEPMTGLSVRAFDPTTGSWTIHWMDSRTPRFGLPYVGRFAGGRGEFFRTVETPQGPRRDRITFADVTADGVRWELAVSRDDGRTWTTIWTMGMTRAER